MSPVEHTRRTAVVRSLRSAIERAVHQCRISLDLPASAATDHLIAEALRDVAQLHATRADSDLDLDLNRQEKTT